MIHKELEFKICPDHITTADGCDNCDYCRKDRDSWECQVFNILGQTRLSAELNFCPVSGQLNPNYSDEGPKIHAVFPDGTKLEIVSIVDIVQSELYIFRALCIFVDNTYAWVSFDFIKNEAKR